MVRSETASWACLSADQPSTRHPPSLPSLTLACLALPLIPVLDWGFDLGALAQSGAAGGGSRQVVRQTLCLVQIAQYTGNDAFMSVFVLAWVAGRWSGWFDGCVRAPQIRPASCYEYS